MRRHVSRDHLPSMLKGSGSMNAPYPSVIVQHTIKQIYLARQSMGTIAPIAEEHLRNAVVILQQLLEETNGLTADERKFVKESIEWFRA